MAFFRQYIAPLLVFLVFLVALIAVSARIFLPADLAAPAPTSEVEQDKAASAPNATEPVARSNLSILVKGLPEDPALSALL